jgi:hypothetical protein
VALVKREPLADQMIDRLGGSQHSETASTRPLSSEQQIPPLLSATMSPLAAMIRSASMLVSFSYLRDKSARGGLRTFANLAANGKDAPIPAV